MDKWMLRIIHILILFKKSMIKTLNLIGDHVRTSKYKNIFAKGYTPNWSEDVFVIKKVRNTVPSTYVINDLNGEEIIGTFYEKELQKTNQKDFRIKKVNKRKGDKLYVKWKGYDNSLDSWIDKKISIISYMFKNTSFFATYKNESIFSKTLRTIWWIY